MSRSFLTNTTLPMFRRDDLVMTRMDPWCASGKYNLMSYACGSLIPGSFGISTLSKIRIHSVFHLVESHCFITATIRSASFSSATVLNSAEVGYSLYKRLAIPAKLCFNVLTKKWPSKCLCVLSGTQPPVEFYLFRLVHIEVQLFVEIHNLEMLLLS